MNYISTSTLLISSVSTTGGLIGGVAKPIATFKKEALEIAGIVFMCVTWSNVGFQIVIITDNIKNGWPHVPHDPN
jgi:hypothetical protein